MTINSPALEKPVSQNAASEVGEDQSTAESGSTYNPVVSWHPRSTLNTVVPTRSGDPVQVDRRSVIDQQTLGNRDRLFDRVDRWCMLAEISEAPRRCVVVKRGWTHRSILAHWHRRSPGRCSGVTVGGYGH